MYTNTYAMYTFEHTNSLSLQVKIELGTSKGTKLDYIFAKVQQPKYVYEGSFGQNYHNYLENIVSFVSSSSGCTIAMATQHHLKLTNIFYSPKNVKNRPKKIKMKSP